LDLLNGHGQHQHGGPNNRNPTSTYAANYSIVTETGNNNSATIQQTGDKHVSSYSGWLKLRFWGYKKKRLSLSLVKTKSSNRITWRQKHG
jgi:hypothetical protein